MTEAAGWRRSVTEEMGRTGYFIVVLALGFVIQMTALGFGRLPTRPFCPA